MTDPLIPPWEMCKVCGGDHWTKDHPDLRLPPEKQGPMPPDRHDNGTLIPVTAALTALRERVILTQLDPCFCDDYGQLPECEACLRARAVLAEIDRALEP
jgi:hypothetical protein